MFIKGHIIVRLSQLAVLSCFAGLFHIYPFLEQRLTAEGMVQCLAFHLAYGLTLAAAVGVVFTLSSWFTNGLALIKAMPIRSGIFVLNALVFVVIIFTIFTQWGVITCMCFGAVFFLWPLLLSGERRRQALELAVTRSIFSFWLFFFALGMGEVYFRFHPEQVGGGGGGNPALRHFYKGLYQTNAHGLRDSEFPLEPSEHESRILVLGDSFTYGQGVAMEETFPQRIEALLNRGGTGDRFVQVINGGKAGANTRWEVEFLKNKGWAFAPDLVLLQFFANDIEITTAPKEKSQNNLLELFFRKPLSRSYVAFFLRFHFDQLVRSFYVRADDNLPKDWLWGLAAKVEANHPAWRECREAFKELAVGCREKGVPAVVVLFPHPGEVHGAIKVIHEAVGQVCVESGLPCIDLTDPVKELAPETQIVTRFDQHPSSAYHALAARCVVDRLRKSWPALIQ